MTMPRLEDCARDLATSTLFLTRLPWPSGMPAASADMARAAWSYPIVGIGVGVIGAVAYGVAYRIGLTPWPSAALSIGATLLATGCLHEDGLADTADGFGGGKTREQKLAIMRDSRIGTYGVCALILVLLLRAAALANIGAAAPVAWALIASHGGARAAMVVLMALVPPARHDGLAAGVGAPPQESLLIVVGLSVLIFAISLGFGLGLVALVLVAAATALMAWLSVSQIGGQSGDVIGALEQVCEVVILLVALG